MRHLRHTPVAAPLGALVLGALLLAGCGRAGSDGGAKASASPDGQFPATVSAGNGQVTVPARPRRIVSLAATATEMLFAIGADNQVIAVDELSNFPAAAPRTGLSGLKPNAGAIIGYSPDLVVLARDTEGIVAPLTAAHIPVLVEPPAAKLDDTYDQLRDLGRATGHAAAADRFAADLKARITATVARAPRLKKPLTYYHELDDSYDTVTSKTFVGRIYGMFGLRNIADAADRQGGGYPQLAPEYIVAAKPDLVFLADTKCCKQSLATLRKRPTWRRIPAVRRGNVVELDDDVACRWGPRVVDLVESVAQAITQAITPASTTASASASATATRPA